MREPVKLRATLREGGAVRFEITVIDLSSTGFRGETFHHLRPGALVWITLPGLSGLEAEIAWQRGEYFGCRFRQPLHPAVFEHIVALGHGS